MADFKLTPEVKDILQKSTITGNNLQLPPVQLDRKLYEQVNKVIVLAGGKWNRSAKAHVFPDNPMKKLGLTLETGIAKDEKKLYQSFYTPKDLAFQLVELAEVKGQTVLEPSAGEGALVDACYDAGAMAVHAYEINPEAIAKLINKGLNVTDKDFLTVIPRPYKRICMNPPFTKNQDIKHVEHALKFLDNDGILTAIMSCNTSRDKFQTITDNYDCDIIPIDAGTFKESGTNIATIILKVVR